MTVILILVILVIVSAVLFLHYGSRKSSAKKETAAKRLSNLLISEIKLFETYKVEKGLKNNNLYYSLQNELEEAEKKYRKSFPEQNCKTFFDEAVLTILADGNREKLGTEPNAIAK